MTKELQPFFDQTDIVAPHISYINTLYVYPHAIGLGKLKGPSASYLAALTDALRHQRAKPVDPHQVDGDRHGP